jgi:hypothetical protein
VVQPAFLDQWANFSYVEKIQWEKWAAFLLIGKRFLVQQNVDNVGKIQENEMRFFKSKNVLNTYFRSHPGVFLVYFK